MDGFLCMKALTLSGQGYMTGDFIPAEKVLPSRVRTLIREKYITPATGPKEEKAEPEEDKAAAEPKEEKAAASRKKGRTADNAKNAATGGEDE